MSHHLKKSPVPAVLERGINAVSHAAVHRWDGALKDIRRTQERELLKIVRHARKTEYGKKHRFSEIRSYEDYRARVSVGDYDSFSPYIERMRAGEHGLLVPEKVLYFGNSSGSSTKGKPKFLPITERQIALQRKLGADVMHRYMTYRGHSKVMLGYTVGIAPAINMRKEGDVLITNNPSLMMARMPKAGRLMMLPDMDTMTILDSDERLSAIAEKYLDYDVHAITGTTCWFSVLFDKLLEAAQRRGRDVTTIAEIWPNLEVLIGGGVAAGPYLSVIRERIGRDGVELIDTYNATEGGIFASTDFRPEAGMLMIPHRGVFFEFVPADEVGKEDCRRVALWDVEPGQLYAIVVTTVSGLYSYLLGDLVRFVSPERIEFAGRLSGCLSTTQELTTHIEIQNAFDAACEASPAVAVDFAAGGDVGVDGTGKSRYVLFAEFQPGRAPEDPRAFVNAFDVALQKLNRVYGKSREGEVGILPAEMVILPEGSTTRFMADIGNVSTQSKFPRIVDDERRDILRGYDGTVVRGGSE